jgi:hypothetical protein
MFRNIKETEHKLLVQENGANGSSLFSPRYVMHIHNNLIKPLYFRPLCRSESNFFGAYLYLILYIKLSFSFSFLFSVLVFFPINLKNLVLVAVSVLISALVHAHVMFHTLVWACSNFLIDIQTCFFFNLGHFPFSEHIPH